MEAFYIFYSTVFKRNKSPATSVFQENAATPFCCEAPEMLCGRDVPSASASRWRLMFLFYIFGWSYLLKAREKIWLWSRIKEDRQAGFWPAQLHLFACAYKTLTEEHTHPAPERFSQSKITQILKVLRVWAPEQLFHGLFSYSTSFESHVSKSDRGVCFTWKQQLFTTRWFVF